MLVVVESRERGGSLITATEALHRSVEVMAVPGSPRSRAAAGTNQLLRDGAAPVTAIADVFMALGLDHRRSLPLPFDSRPLPAGVDARVLEACAEVARSLDEIASQFSLTVAESAMSLARLERDGWLLEAGGWFETAGSRVG